jgi:MFS family permease
VTALQFIPFLIVAPLAGLLADRAPRRSLIIGVQSFLVAVSIAMGALVWSGSMTTWWIYAFAVVSGAAAALDTPARQALLGDIVGQDRLVNAVALNSVTFNLARISGPAVGGVLIVGLGVAPVFFVTAGLFGLALWAVWSLHSLASPRNTSPEARPTLRAGLAFVRSDRSILFGLTLVAVVATFGLNFQLTTALMSTVEFGGTAASFGLLTTFLSLGSLAGSLLAARRRVVRVRLVAGAAIVFSAVTAVTGLMPTWGLYAVTLPLCGLTAMTFTTAVQSFVQLRTPAHLRGRVMGFYTVLFFAGTPIGAPLIGWLSDQFGPRVGLVGGGLISLLGALALTAMLLRRRLAQSTDRQGHTRDAGGEQQTAEDAGADADGQQQEVDPDERTRYRDDDARDPRPAPR